MSDDDRTFGGWPALAVQPERWGDTCRHLKNQGMNYLASLTAVHYIDDAKMELVAHLYAIGDDGRLKTDHPQGQSKLQLKTAFDHQADISIESIASVWPTAEWHEREVYDMFGIKFDGNPDFRRILMEMDYDAHPLRKDFEDCKPNLGVSQETLQKDAASNR